mmetsp:Transcript_43581/g.88123  ORF Transcript_43581/g.88123 Transcript_43581/m.88123 type:complete len:279 (-) Transcript_43581:182-1018(-)
MHYIFLFHGRFGFGGCLFFLRSSGRSSGRGGDHDHERSPNHSPLKALAGTHLSRHRVGGCARGSFKEEGVRNRAFRFFVKCRVERFTENRMEGLEAELGERALHLARQRLKRVVHIFGALVLCGQKINARRKLVHNRQKARRDFDHGPVLVALGPVLGPHLEVLHFGRDALVAALPAVAELVLGRPHREPGGLHVCFQHGQLDFQRHHLGVLLFLLSLRRCFRGNLFLLACACRCSRLGVGSFLFLTASSLFLFFWLLWVRNYFVLDSSFFALCGSLE